MTVRTLLAIFVLCATSLRCGLAAAAPSDTDPHRFAVRTPADVPFFHLDAVEGAAPTAAHARGSVLVAELAQGDPAPCVDEWDVASGQLLRHVLLPLPRSFAVLHAVRAGGRVHVVAAEPRGGAIAYVRLDGALKVESTEQLGRGYAELATDGDLVAVLWSGASGGATPAREWRAVTLAGTQRIAAARLFETAADVGGSLRDVAVVQGKVFILSPGVGLPPLMRYSADLRFEDQLRPTQTPFERAIFPAGRRLLDETDGMLRWRDPLTLGTLETHGAPPAPGHHAWAPELTVVDDGTGRMVTSLGDVLDRAAAVSLHLDDIPRDKVVATPLWISGTAALLEVRTPDLATSIVWRDPPAP